MACLLVVTNLSAQRKMETLGRGLVAVKNTQGVFLSWRLLGEEWYGVTYNVYRDGTKLNDTPLEVSNYVDAAGTTSSSYTVRAVVRGVEQEACAAVTPWNAQYKDVKMADVFDAAGNNINSKYTLNDVSAADLDGDGEYELIVKRQNLDFTKANTVYTLFQAYKLDGTLLWTINVGPNLFNASNVETNCLAFDFNEDGKAEVVFRATDGTVLPNGTVVGNATANYRPASYSDGNSVYQTQGDEWLYVLEGATGKVIDSVIFDADQANGNNLARRNAAFWWEGNSKAYGHRANKFHFGAPYLDGRHPSIYVGRGCYTNIHMATYDLVNGKLKLRWTYACDDTSSPFYGQGYHNFSIVDVDEDGRDEICHGNMVIDEYGKELSSTGLGHGDAQHYGDLDPYRKGVEGFRCLEDNPGAVFVDAATNELLFRWVRGTDNGRCLAGNFTDAFPGAELWTTDGHLWSATLSRDASATVANSAPGVTMNNRIYWDGDILEESFDYVNGTDTDGAVYKYGNGSPIFRTSGCSTNNHSKGNPCIQADLLGDWREEIVMRTTDNMCLRIYTTVNVTEHRNYTLMHDKQYRQAIYWQMCGYNQPPHVSYFLGEAEGITVPPPPVMTNGRVIATAAVDASHNDKHVLLLDENGGTVTLGSGVKPYVLTVNSNGNYTLTGGSLAGEMQLVKQGHGTLAFSGDHTYTGATELWQGVTEYTNGTLNSPVWVNRFAELNTDKAIYNKGIKMEHGAILRPGGNNNKGTVTMADFTTRPGAIIELDIYSDGLAADQLVINNAWTANETNNNISHVTFRFIQHNLDGAMTPASGKYLIAACAAFNGDLAQIQTEGLRGVRHHLEFVEGEGLYLIIEDVRAAAQITWNGGEQGAWDFYLTKNFMLGGTADYFTTGDHVLFDETAASKEVSIIGEVVPASVTVKGDANYTFKGDGEIAGPTGLTKEGNGVLTITGRHPYEGVTVLKGGETVPAALATQQNAGSLGALSSNAANFVIQDEAILTINGEMNMESPITLGEGGGVIKTNGTLHMKAPFAGGTLTKTGEGSLRLYAANKHSKTILDGGTLTISEEPNVQNGYLGDTVIIKNGTLQCLDNSYSYSNAPWHIVVPAGGNGRINLDGRCEYNGNLYGAGNLTIYAPYVRNYLNGDFSKFTGTMTCMQGSGGDFALNNNNGMPYATLNVASGCTVRNNKGGVYKVAAVTGSGSLGGTHGWIVGRNGNDINTFSGSITGSGTTLTKVGSNTFACTGNSTMTGSVTVQEGTLLANNRASTKGCFGSGQLYVKEGAVLTGQGYIGNSTVKIEAGATFSPGYFYTGSLGVASTLTVYTDGVLELRLNSVTNGVGSLTSVDKVKALIFDGILRVGKKNSLEFSLGDTFNLWTVSGAVKGTPQAIELPELPEGLAWDTTELMTKTGTIRVTDATGVGITAWDEEVEVTVVNLDGMQLESFTAPYNQVQESLDNTSLPAGLYILKMQSKNGCGAVKMMKR